MISGGKKGGSGGGPIYKPKYSGVLEGIQTGGAIGDIARVNPNLVNQLLKTPEGQGMASQFGLGPRADASSFSRFATNPSQINYGDLAGRVNRVGSNMVATSMGGASQPFQFTGQYGSQQSNVVPVSNQAYDDVIQREQEGMQQDVKKFGEQISRQAGARGMGRSGLTQGAFADLSRGAQEQMAQFRSQLGLQKAQGAVDAQKFADTFGQGERQFAFTNEAQRQQAQAAENLSRFQNQLGLEQYLNSLELQKIGTEGGLAEKEQAQAMRPYQQLQQLYGMNIGIPVTPSSGGKGDPLSALIGAAGSIGSSFILK